MRQAIVHLRALAPLAAASAFAVLVRFLIVFWMAQRFGGVAHAMCHFDCNWYRRIAMGGYGAPGNWRNYGSAPNWAFFPLYPLLLRASVALTGLAPDAAGLALSNVCFAGFIMTGALWLRATERRTVDVALWIVFATLFPYSLFFSAVYSEALHALLATGVLLALARGRLWPAALLAALLSATRPTGVLMAPAIALAGLWQMRGLVRRPLPWPALGEGLARLAPVVAVAPLGLFLFMAWQYIAVGDALAFSHVQIDWGRAWRGPVAWLQIGFGNHDVWLLGDLFGRVSTTLNAGAGVIGLLAALWMAARRRVAAAWYCGAATLLALSSGLNSLPRIVATNPAFLFAAFDLVARLRRPAAVAALFGLLAALQAVFLVAWFLGAPGLL